MNLEKVISELNYLKSGGTYAVQMPAQVIATGTAQPEQITAGLNPPAGAQAPAGLKAPVAAKAKPAESEWVDPTEKREEQDDEDSRLLKPSDFFGM